MAEQEADDYLMSLGDGERRELMEDFEKKPKKKGRPRKSEEEKKQRIKEYNAKYWADHKEQISARRKETYKRDRDAIIRRNKQWLENNKEHWNAYQREYRRKKKLDKKEQV